MAKTRSRDLHVQIKKEECEDKPKLNQLLHRTKNTKKNRSKITKKEKTAKTEPMQAQIAKVKTENTDDNKAILTLPMRTSRRTVVTTEQITELIGYIVNDKMTVTAASRKARMSYMTAQRYYQEHQDDPEHKIPLPRTNLNTQSSKLRQKKIEDLINYIVNDKMSLNQAAYKAELNRKTAVEYYTKYMEDPDHKIPTLDISRNYPHKLITQEEIKELIGYIVNSNMSVTAAAKKKNMTTDTAKKYYLKYLQDPNHNFPAPGNPSSGSNKRCTNEQVKQLIGYIVDDRVSLLDASVKADMSMNTARKHYQQYLDDPNHNIPTPETDNKRSSKNYPTLDHVKNFFSCIIIDKLNVKQASLKANISNSSGQKYYTRYLKNPTNTAKSNYMPYSVEKMEKMVEYIQKDKMTIKLAATKANLGYETALKHYRRYLKDPQLGIPKVKNKQYTQEDIKRLIGYIVHDKMGISSAARRIKMTNTTAYKYYNKYQKDPKHKVPIPSIGGYKLKHRAIDKYSQLIADIYTNNPSIKPIHENHSHSDSSLPDIKLELLDENTKMNLKDEK